VHVATAAEQGFANQQAEDRTAVIPPDGDKRSTVLSQAVPKRGARGCGQSVGTDSDNATVVLLLARFPVLEEEVQPAGWPPRSARAVAQPALTAELPLELVHQSVEDIELLASVRRSALDSHWRRRPIHRI